MTLASDGLLAYYTFTAAAGEPHSDLSGNGNTMLDYSNMGHSEEGLNGHCAYGDDTVVSTSDYCLYIADGNLPATWPGKDGGSCSAYTFYIRARITTTVHVDQIRGIFAKRYAWGQNFSTELMQSYSNASNVSAGHYDGDTNYSISCGTSNDTTNFHTWIVRWDGDDTDEFAVWYDGTKKGTTYNPTSIGSTASFDSAIGAFKSGSNTAGMCAAVDEFSLWDRALTLAEISQLANNGIVGLLRRRRITVSKI